jgi:hypothetical protein
MRGRGSQFEVEMDAINQFLFAGDADAAQHAARHCAEHGFDDPCVGVKTNSNRWGGVLARLVSPLDVCAEWLSSRRRIRV